ncbi:PIF1-like helicase-domain-containing protein, partial [Pavlovales sp. CCMP2436]
MASAELLDKLEAVARNLRNSDLPFGGMQLVFCGDFFQLPPVSRREGPPAHYAFQSRAWVRSSLQTVELIKIWRQSDAELIEMLTEVRKGRVSAKSLRVLAACERPPDHTSLAPGVRPTKLYTHRADCEEINQQQLAALEGKSVVIRAADSGTGLFCSNSGELLSGCVAKAALELKEGAQVLLLKS